MMTPEQCLKKAWEALLRGDTVGRDRWCGLARTLYDAQARVRQRRPIIEGKLIELSDGTLELKLP